MNKTVLDTLVKLEQFADVHKLAELKAKFAQFRKDLVEIEEEFANVEAPALKKIFDDQIGQLEKLFEAEPFQAKDPNDPKILALVTDPAYLQTFNRMIVMTQALKRGLALRKQLELLTDNVEEDEEDKEEVKAKALAQKAAIKKFLEEQDELLSQSQGTLDDVQTFNKNTAEFLNKEFNVEELPESKKEEEENPAKDFFGALGDLFKAFSDPKGDNVQQALYGFVVAIVGLIANMISGIFKSFGNNDKPNNDVDTARDELRQKLLDKVTAKPKPEAKPGIALASAPSLARGAAAKPKGPQDIVGTFLPAFNKARRKNESLIPKAVIQPAKALGKTLMTGLFGKRRK